MGLNISNGKWSREFDPEYPDKISIECDAGTDSRGFIALIDFGNHQEANADFIIEAGTVANECGLTPRQLLEQNKQLLAALKVFAKCAEQIDDDEDDEEWAKFRLTIGDYRRAQSVLTKANGESND